MRKVTILLGGAALLTACAPNPAPAPPAVVVDPNNPLFAPGYMATASSSDQFEIQSSQLAMQMSHNPAVRNFANMLVADHMRSTQMVAAAARSARITPPPPALLPQHQAMLAQLRAAGAGPNFDMTFKQIQTGAHQDALQLHQTYAASGDVPALRTAAGQIAPVVQRHLNHLQMLNVAPPRLPYVPPLPPAGRAGERG